MVFLVGLCGLVAQAVIIREMVVAFHGNELSIGVMLGSWLLWTGLGSLGLGWLVSRLPGPRLWLAAALLAAALALVGTIVAARCLNILVDLEPATLTGFVSSPGRAAGEMARAVVWPHDAVARLAALHAGTVPQVRPFRVMLIASLLLLGPFCLLKGAFFPLACRAVADAGRRTAPGRVYLAEAAGAAVGGAGYSFALVHWVDPIVLGFVLAAALGAGAAWVAWAERRAAVAKGLLALAGCATAALAAACLAGTPAAVGAELEAAFWHPRELVSSADSRYGRVSVVRQPQQTAQCTLFHSGTLAFTYPHPPAAEEVAHLPMLQHAEPRRVLLLGGDLVGVVREVLKHRSVDRRLAEKVTCVALDPLVVEVVETRFPEAAADVLRRDGVRVELGDGRRFLKTTPERFDVIINAQPPPTTALANRYYTLECFQEVARVLEPGGVFAFRAAGGETYISEENRRVLACLHRTLREVFPSVVVFPGAQAHFLASSREGVVGYDLGELDKRQLKRGVETSYVDVYAWNAALISGRDRIDAALQADPAPPLNRDLTPRCYYFEAQRWSTLQRTREERARVAEAEAERRPAATAPPPPGSGAAAAPGAQPPHRLDLGRRLERRDEAPALAPLVVLAVVAAASLAAPLVVLGLLATASLARRRWRDGALTFAVTSTGLLEMAVEFVILLGFQVAYGYVYQYVGMLTGLFMLGLTLGAAVSSRWVARERATWRRMAWVQGGICIYPLLLIGFLVLTTRVELAATPTVAALSFGAMALMAGVLPGMQFPVAAALHSRGSSAAGALYGLDLFGACLGALAVSSVLVPLSGLVGVCMMLVALAALGFVGVAAAAFGQRRAA